MGVTIQKKFIRCLAGSQIDWGEFREGGVPCSQECLFKERQDAKTSKSNWYGRLHMVKTHLQNGKFKGRPALGSHILLGFNIFNSQNIIPCSPDQENEYVNLLKL